MELTFNKKMILEFALAARIRELNARIEIYEEIIAGGDSEITKTTLENVKKELAETIEFLTEVENYE